jgi:hypothetical protein
MGKSYPCGLELETKMLEYMAGKGQTADQHPADPLLESPGH